MENTKELIAERWVVYKTLKAGGKAFCGDRKVFTELKKRLKATKQFTKEDLDRFVLLKE